MKINREDAIGYLQRKNKISEDIVEHPKFTEAEEQEIKTVMKEGRIYGDPLVELN